MNLLHVTDLHFHKPHFDWVWKQRLSVDAVCITGDFLDDHINAASVREQIAWIEQYLEAFERPLFICSGNHDVIEPDLSKLSMEKLFYGEEVYEQTHWIKNITNKNIVSDGQIKDLEGYRFGCIGYESFNFSSFEHCDILLAHLPPAKTNVSREKQGGDFGCTQLRSALLGGDIKPKVVLSGHVHQPISVKDFIRNSELFNPGSDNSFKIPSHTIMAIR